MSSDSGRIWSTGVGGGKKQRGLLMTRQTNRVGMHSVDFQGGKASSTSTSTNFSSVVWLRLLSTLDENISRESCFLFSRTRGWFEVWSSSRNNENGKTSSDSSLFESLKKQILYCVVLRKKDFESQKLKYFFPFFFILLHKQFKHKLYLRAIFITVFKF